MQAAPAWSDVVHAAALRAAAGIVSAVNRRRMAGMLLTAGHVRHPLADLLRGQRPRLMIRAHVVADRLQPFQNPLPLRPIERPQERPKPLDERVFEHRLAIRLRDEEAIQSHA